jgi:hypothetical protein
MEFRGLTVRLEQGSVTVTDGVLKVVTGTAVVTGAQDQPLTFGPGSSFSLLRQPAGPVFKAVDR